ncbi:PDR/VanB family oxidoreductase [Streptomyces sp. NPDC002896]|uniref:PDR/VanB family oxidoreductase n=1 Tax=Streptomyces sp. NPDC002896 TaxID=3154438 RepID=UPI00332BFB1C
MHPITTYPAPPPDLYGRDRGDRLMRALTAFTDTYIPLVTRTAERRSRYRRPTGPADSSLRLVVAERRTDCGDVVSLRLTAGDGGRLPRWQAGSHIDLHLPAGRRRQYSLCGDPADRYGYSIAVRRLDGGGGGSVEVHDSLTPGSSVTVTGPRNAFPFAADPAVLLIAGGIGITPILPMAREAAQRGLDWRLIHTGRTRASLPLATELARLDSSRVEIVTDDEHGVPDCGELLRRAPAGAAVYCCGPAPMLDGIRAAFDRLGPGRLSALHFERFAPPPITDGRPFDVELKYSQRVLPVPADRSALDVLRENLPAVPYSCRQGFCGVCRQHVVSGSVEHRDRRLTDEERADGEMLVCVSRAPEGERLLLDL